MPGAATAFTLRLRLHYKAARVGEDQRQGEAGGIEERAACRMASRCVGAGASSQLQASYD